MNNDTRNKQTIHVPGHGEAVIVIVTADGEEVNIMEDKAVTCREQLYRLNKPNVEQLCPVEWRTSVLLHHKDGVVEALHLQEGVHVWPGGRAGPCKESPR